MRIGKISISNSIILELLKFENGKIHNIYRDPDCINEIAICIEHPDMPEIDEGDFIPEVHPLYQRNNLGFVERISPKNEI